MIKLIPLAVFGLGFAVNAVAADMPEPNATLTKIEGKKNVMVNTGTEFAPATAGMRLKPGDQHQIANPQLGYLLVFVLEGSIDVTIGESITRLGRGDALDAERLPSCSIEAFERADLLIASQRPSPRD